MATDSDNAQTSDYTDDSNDDNSVLPDNKGWVAFEKGLDIPHNLEPFLYATHRLLKGYIKSTDAMTKPLRCKEGHRCVTKFGFIRHENVGKQPLQCEKCFKKIKDFERFYNCNESKCRVFVCESCGNDVKKKRFRKYNNKGK